MSRLINGLHHITALGGEPQANLDFYAGVLGLRLVKKTINFDATNVYHLYYGDETGQPGTIMTFFPYPGITRGRIGTGQVTITSFSIPANSVDYWAKRLESKNIPFQSPSRRGDETVLPLEDPDGLLLELVATDQDKRSGWTQGDVPAEHAIRGFFGISVCVGNPMATQHLLTTTLEHTVVDEHGGRTRLQAGDGGPGTLIDLVCPPNPVRGLQGGGTIHHVAFSTDSDETQKQIREKLAQAGMQVTAVLDRQYFHSIYFREPGGVLFEVATTPPGFARDEEVAELGTSLKLPPWEEKNRERIEQNLQPITMNS